MRYEVKFPAISLAKKFTKMLESISPKELQEKIVDVNHVETQNFAFLHFRTISQAVVAGFSPRCQFAYGLTCVKISCC